MTMAPELRFDVPLDTGALLTVSVHSPHEVAWKFSYRGRYTDPDDPADFKELRGREVWDRVGMTIDYTLIARYKDGDLVYGKAKEASLPWPSGVQLTLKLVMPKKRGIKWAYGVDISPGSEAWFEFYYTLAKDPVRLEAAPDIPVRALRLCEVYGGELGKHRRIEVPESEPGSLVVPGAAVDVPFPVVDVVTPRFPGSPYRIPFLDESRKVQYFEFPASIKARS